MPQLGGGNPLPFGLGGGPSQAEQAYDALRQAVGIGGSGPREGVREGWRFARARGLAASMADARAFYQWFPDLATDMLPMYEQILDAPPAPLDSEQARRARVTELWIRLITAVAPNLDAKLAEIDPSIVVVPLDPDLSRRAVPGRGFEDWDPSSPAASGPPFNLVTGSQSLYANYADEYVLYVSFPLPAGVLSDSNLLTLNRVYDLLNDVLPAWMDFHVFTQDGGFTLDEDLLDLTVFA